MNDIRIYVADLSAYNNGKLHGTWIDATLDLEDIKKTVNKMLDESPEDFSEEYAIHDFEGFESYSLNEYEGLESAHEVACFIEQWGKLGSEILNEHHDIEKATSILEEDYCGCYESLADYAQELTEETTQIPESLALYIDYERMAQDLEMGGDIFTIETAHNEVHIFMNR